MPAPVPNSLDDPNQRFDPSWTPEERLKWYSEHLCAPVGEYTFDSHDRTLVLQEAWTRRPWVDWLSIGCHDGGEVRWMARRPDMIEAKVRVVALEPARSCHEEIKRWLARQAAPIRSRYTFVRGGVEDLTAIEAFDIATVYELLEHFRENEAWPYLLKRVWTALRPEGRLFISTPEYDGAFGVEKNADYGQHLKIWHRDELVAWLEDKTGSRPEIFVGDQYENLITLSVTKP